jgi:signal transduction histidine kinase
VLLNLIGNAVKFVSGRPRGDVTVRLRRAGTMAEVAVSDTGPGIPEEWRPRIFAPFARVPGTTAAGSGIGLATVHRIVRGHGGDVAIVANAVEGVTFVVTLPAAGEVAPAGGTDAALDASR